MCILDISAKFSTRSFWAVRRELASVVCVLSETLSHSLSSQTTTPTTATAYFFRRNPAPCPSPSVCQVMRATLFIGIGFSQFRANKEIVLTAYEYITAARRENREHSCICIGGNNIVRTSYIALVHFLFCTRTPRSCRTTYFLTIWCVVVSCLKSRKCPANFFKIGAVSGKKFEVYFNFPEVPLLIGFELVLIRWLEYKEREVRPSQVSVVNRGPELEHVTSTTLVNVTT